MQHPFIQAVIEANRKIFKHIESGLNEEDFLESVIGEGGDVSKGIDLFAEMIFKDHLLEFGTLYSEESGFIYGKHDVEIIIDPIDGSQNLVSGVPYYGTSVYYNDKTKNEKISIICNLANKDICVKYNHLFQKSKLEQLNFQDVITNRNSRLGIFEKAYLFSDIVEQLRKKMLKFRSFGAVALSLAYAHDVDFVLFKGPYRAFDVEAGLHMCDDLYTFIDDDILIVSKDQSIFFYVTRDCEEC